jgi:hypothetical protein
LATFDIKPKFNSDSLYAFKKTVMNLDGSEGFAVLAALVAPVVLLLNYTNII